MSYTLIWFFLIRWTSKSSGPSNDCSRILMSSSCDSNVSSDRFGVSGASLECFSVTSILQLYGRANALHGFLGDALRLARAFDENVTNVARARFGFRAALADGLEQRIDRVGELGLDLDVAHRAFTVAGLEVVDFGAVRIERVVIDEHGIALDRARNVSPHTLRVGIHLP